MIVRSGSEVKIPRLWILPHRLFSSGAQRQARLRSSHLRWSCVSGAGDLLTQIKGIGPKLQAALYAVGIFHFEQIAGWTSDEVAWVDENIVSVKGRASRDDWVAKARALIQTEVEDDG